ncbi:hypothetical protein Hanom_Chr04g00358561 [Helianthus anomalus]
MLPKCYAVNIGDISVISPHVKYRCQILLRISVPILSAILTDITDISLNC